MRRGRAVTATPTELVRVTGLAVALALAPVMVVGFVYGRLTAAPPVLAPPPRGGIHYQGGVPHGFPLNPQGAGDAAAWYITLLSTHAHMPPSRRRALIVKLTVPRFRHQVTAALSPRDGAPGSRAQYMPLRAWAGDARRAQLKPEGATVTVELYEVAVPATATGAGRAATSGEFYLQRIQVQRHRGEWRLRRVYPPVGAPQAAADQAEIGERAMLTRVLGPDSWVPYMR
jgi:hypothetical protein